MIIARHAWIALLDTAMLIAFLALMAPGKSTGFEWHEWLGLVFVPLFVLHVVLSWNWIAGTWRRVWSDTHPRARINFLLNTSLAISMIIVIVSGIAVSDFALPAMGAHAINTDRWRRLHNSTSSLVLIVVGLHLGLNWSWINGAIKRYATSRFRRRTDLFEAQQ